MNRVSVDSIELATVDQGAGVDQGTGGIVVLVHGFPLDHTMWQGQIDPLSQRHRVLAPDLRGFGQSGVSDGTVTMAQYADDLAAMLGQLDVAQPVTLCGLSMGGYIALEFWRRHRDRLAALVLCDTRAATDSPEAAAGRRATADRVLEEGPSILVETMLPRLFADVTRQRGADCVDATRQVILSGNPRGIAAASRGMAERADFRSQLGQIDVPTLLLTGEHDVISPPEEMRGLAEAMPRAQWTGISEAGHMAPLENPAETNAAILAFLAEVQGL